MQIVDSTGVAQQTMVPSVFTVERRRRETADTFTLELTHARRTCEFEFSPGQFNMLYVPGVGEVPISISGDPEKPGKLIHTIRAVGPVTRALCALKPGGNVGVRGPYGTSWPVDGAKGRDVLIMAGGIGLAPLRPAIYQILANRSDFNHVTLLYGARTPNDLLFARELEKWRSRFDFRLLVTVDSAEPDWRGIVGIVTMLLPSAHFTPNNVVAMVCGPEIMMMVTVKHILQREVAPEDIYISMERNMKCAVGICGHCQLGPEFICKDGPIFSYAHAKKYINVREL
jgi:NAD(P)H-flavin reductase